MRPAKIIQIEATTKEGVIYLYGLDVDGRIWLKLGGDDSVEWERIS